MMRRTRSLVSRLMEGLSLQVRDYLYDYATPEQQLYKSMIALILRSAAAGCIVPMQDWLGLFSSTLFLERKCLSDDNGFGIGTMADLLRFRNGQIRPGSLFHEG